MQKAMLQLKLNLCFAATILLFLLATETLSQGERATLPLILQPRPLKGSCPSQDEISEIHDEVRSVLQDLNGINSSDSLHCWVDHSNGDTQHCFSEEQWNKLQDDIKEGIYKELQEELINELAKIKEMLQNTTDKIQDDLDQAESQLNQNITQLHSEIAQVQGDLDQTGSEFNQNIVQLHSEIAQVQGELDQTESEFNQNIVQLHSEIAQVQGDLDQTESKLNQNITQLEHKIKVPSSCKELFALDPSLPSGYYSIRSKNDTLLPMYCGIPRENCGNGTAGGWTRVAYLNMANPTHQCPSVWREITTPIRTCGRNTDSEGCDTVIFGTNGIQYKNILGRVVGYQYGNPEAFADTDVDGVMITQASLTKHIWSFAAERTDNSYCPCSIGSSQTAPAFFGEDYFCESGVSPGASPAFLIFQDDPLWDGEGCGDNPTCCTYNNPPWFCKQLPEATTDDIEISICTNGNHLTNEDTPVELIEIYIQ